MGVGRFVPTRVYVEGRPVTVASEPIARLSRALAQTGALIARVRPEQATLPTPCRAWVVVISCSPREEQIVELVLVIATANWTNRVNGGLQTPLS